MLNIRNILVLLSIIFAQAASASTDHGTSADMASACTTNPEKDIDGAELNKELMYPLLLQNDKYPEEYIAMVYGFCEGNRYSIELVNYLQDGSETSVVGEIVSYAINLSNQLKEAWLFETAEFYSKCALRHSAIVE